MDWILSRRLSWRAGLRVRRSVVFEFWFHECNDVIKVPWMPLLRGVVGTAAILMAAEWVGGQGPSAAEYVVYPCRYKPAADIERMLLDLLPDDPAVNLVADARANRLLLRAPAEYQRIAKSLLESVDRPAAEPRPPVPAEKKTVRAYPCPAGELDLYLDRVNRLDGGAHRLRATLARETNQLLVLASDADHERVRQLLAGRAGPEPRTPAAVRPLPPVDGTERTTGERTTGERTTGERTETELIDRVIKVRTPAITELEQRVVALLADRLQREQRAGQGVYRLQAGDRRELEFQFDAQRGLILARGSGTVVQQFVQLVDALDMAVPGGLRAEALRIQRTSPAQLKQAVDAFRGPVEPAVAHPPSGGPAPSDQSRAGNATEGGGVRLVNYLFQNAQPPAGGAGERPEESGVTTVPNVPGLNQLDVQTLPDLDVMIIRGRSQDVEQLTEIIRELERLSAETKPKIHIYQLKHTLGESIQQILEEVQTDLVGGRQGRVNVTPLTKPNALLLIGWGEAVESLITLINKLDQPVDPDSQFAVFSLRHAAVTAVQQTIEGFFRARTALGPKVQTAIDARTNKMIVYAAPRDMREVHRLIEQLDVAQGDAVNRAQIFRIENSLASDVAATLQQILAAAAGGQAGRSAVLELMTIDEAGQRALQSALLNEVSITPNPRNNTLIVTGPPETIPLVQAFITQLDKAGDTAQIKVFRVINGDASSLISVLQSLLPSQVGQIIGPQLPNAPEESALVPLRFSVEVRSNSIIAVGSEGDLRIVDALLTRLDESESMTRQNAVYLLKNSPAVDVAASVNEFLRSQRQLELAEPGQANPFQDLEREVIVVAEPVGNRLIVSATPRYFDEITQLIDKLDEPPPQVVIQVLLAEVTLNDTDELGFELGIQDSVLFDRGLLGDLLTTTVTRQASDPNGILTSTDQIIQSATNTPGFDFNNKPLGNSGSTNSLATAANVGGQALSHFELGRTNSELNFGGLVLSASSQNISVLIRALQENKQLRILSRPLIRTLDNQPAFIQVGQRVPRIVGSTVGNYGQSNSISLENVGIILGVTPRISPEGNVVMEIDAEKSKIGPEEEGIPVAVSNDGIVIRSPRVDTATAQATVSVADNETVVLGGMIISDEEIITRRAPYLSEIPVLGQLFRYDSTQKRRAELLVILTPHVIRTPEDGERIKQAEFARVHWCAADVYEMYGDIGLADPRQLAVSATQNRNTPVIYPDLNPRGDVQHESPDVQPTPLPLPPGPGDQPPRGSGGSVLPPPPGQGAAGPPPSPSRTWDRPGTYPLPTGTGTPIQQLPLSNHAPLDAGERKDMSSSNPR